MFDLMSVKVSFSYFLVGLQFLVAYFIVRASFYLALDTFVPFPGMYGAPSSYIPADFQIIQTEACQIGGLPWNDVGK